MKKGFTNILEQEVISSLFRKKKANSGKYRDTNKLCISFPSKGSCATALPPRTKLKNPTPLVSPSLT